MEQTYWASMLDNVLPGRVDKPRISGLTMVIDTGVSNTITRDMLQLAAEHIDFWKFGFASASVCPAERIQDKVTLCQEYGVLAYPGGTSLEIAILQDKWRPFLDSLWHHGIRAVEVSDGTIDLPIKLRREIIYTARKAGFTVLSEVGKKIPGTFLPARQQAQLIHGDLNAGANYIIVEGREAGRGIGVYDSEGNVRETDVEALMEAVGPSATRIIWEAPLTMQQVYYIRTLGAKANLGNIRPADIVPLESLRRGFRSDTLRLALGMDDVANEADEHQGVEPSDPSQFTEGGSVSKPTLWTELPKRPYHGRDQAKRV